MPFFLTLEEVQTLFYGHNWQINCSLQAYLDVKVPMWSDFYEISWHFNIKTGSFTPTECLTNTGELLHHEVIVVVVLNFVFKCVTQARQPSVENLNTHTHTRLLPVGMWACGWECLMISLISKQDMSKSVFSSFGERKTGFIFCSPPL